MQEFREILETDTVSDSREYINKGLQTLRSNFAGETFPTENLAVGMKCYRIDKGRTYTLKSLDPLLWEEDGSAVKREDMTNSQLFTEAMTREALKNITDWSHFFSKLPVMEYLDLSLYPIDNATKLEYLFANDFMLKAVTGLLVNGGRESADEDSPENQWEHPARTSSFEGMFYRCESLSALDGEIINTRGVENLKEMFAYCRRLKKLSTGHWRTQKCKTMAGMFKGCEKLEEIDVSKWDVSNVEDFSSMFEGCNSLTARIWKRYDKPENQYFGISDLRAWVTPKAKTTSHMFKRCINMQEIDLSKFDMRNVENAQGMFQDCYNLRNIVCGEHTFSTSKVKNFAHMFDSAFEGISGGGYSYYNQEPTRLLEKMDFSSATNMTAMLRNVSLYNEEVKIDKGDVDAFWDEFANHVGDEKYCARGLSLRINASKLDDIAQMLEGYSQDGIYLEMDTSKVSNMSRLFTDSGAVCIHLKGFATRRALEYRAWEIKNGLKEMFKGCRNLRFLVLASTEFTFELAYQEGSSTYCEDILADLPAECRILVPKALLSTYRAAPVWKEYAERIEAMEDYEFVGSNDMFVRRRKPTAEEHVWMQDTVSFRKV